MNVQCFMVEPVRWARRQATPDDSCVGWLVCRDASGREYCVDHRDRLPAGAMYWADTGSSASEIGSDAPVLLWVCLHEPQCARHLLVVLPDGALWDIDGRASNCTRKDELMHHCWVREGEPPNVTVIGGANLCKVGAGSIATPTYHGFLRNGVLVPC